MSIPYEAPLALMRLAIDQAVASTQMSLLEGRAEILGDVADAVLEGAGRFAREVLSPLNPVGDAHSSRVTETGVVTAPGFPQAYERFRADGWASLSGPEEFGGQGLPVVVSAAVTEMWGGANLAFAMCPECAVGAVECLRVHGAADLRARYLPRLVSGEWTGAMSLTEPQAGSDLSTLRTRAELHGGTWLLSGRKVFISWGDHDLTGNIVHLVLARAPGASEGVKGISLFLVPKKVPQADGTLVPNDIHAVSVEHKMGIRGSPTCVMSMGERGGARGWLVGRLHDGLGCMFTMMNHMRLGVGLHSTGVAERALQLARAYARERLQGRNRFGAQRPIVEHADVRRMLLTMKALTHAARCLAYTAAASLDMAHSAPEADVREAAERRAGLLTPVVKAWCSEVAVEVASLGVQVHGGMGYIDECEASQVYRDARIGPIFEGTNYIQAQDLLSRKIVRDQGAALHALLGEIERAAQALPMEPERLGPLRNQLLSGCVVLRDSVVGLIEGAKSDPEIIGAVAHHFLQWLGVLAGGWQWAIAARTALAAPAADSLAKSMIDTAAFYAAHVLPRMQVHAAVVRSGAAPVVGPDLAEL